MKDKFKQAVSGVVFDYGFIIVGMAVYSLGISVFIKPSGIPMGGVNGVALIINAFTGFPMGVSVIILNIPLFIMAFRSLGTRFLARTVIATVFSSVFIDLFAAVIPVFKGEFMLSAISGGFLMGLGLGAAFSRGATSGGADILSKLINKKAQHLSLGTLNFAISAAVIGISLALNRNLESGLYAFIAIFISSMTADWIVTGMDRSIAAFVITTKPEEVSGAIFTVIHRGATGLVSKGMYTKRDATTLLCAIRSHEITEFKRLVELADPGAFVIVTSAKEVLGLGFKRS